MQIWKGLTKIAGDHASLNVCPVTAEKVAAWLKALTEGVDSDEAFTTGNVLVDFVDGDEVQLLLKFGRYAYRIQDSKDEAEVELRKKAELLRDTMGKALVKILASTSYLESV